MKGKLSSEEQVIGVLKESEAGMASPDLLRKHGISSGTFYRWKAKFVGRSRRRGRRTVTRSGRTVRWAIRRRPSSEQQPRKAACELDQSW